MLIVGLTGGIGSGKSTVSGLFEALGTPVIDTDELARAVVAPGQPALDDIRNRFGRAVFTSDGQLDRSALRRRIFSDERQRHELESLLHPRIRAALRQRLSKLHAPYCIVAIPLLVEKGWQKEVDRILVVDAPENLQIERTRTRPGMDAEQAKRIIGAQAAREERLAAADDVLINDGGMDKLRDAVARLHQHYLAVAATHD